MKHRAIIVIICILAPIIYLVCALATNALVPVRQREMPPAAGQLEAEAFEKMKAEVLNSTPVPAPTPAPTATHEPLPDISLDKPDNYDAVKAEISQKAKEISENVNKTAQTINTRLEDWELPDLEAQELPELDELKMPSVGGIKSEGMPALPSFAEIAAMLPDISLPELPELPSIGSLDIPTISIPEQSFPTLAPMPDLDVPELEKYEFNIPDTIKKMLIPSA